MSKDQSGFGRPYLREYLNIKIFSKNRKNLFDYLLTDLSTVYRLHYLSTPCLSLCLFRTHLSIISKWLYDYLYMCCICVLSMCCICVFIFYIFLSNFLFILSSRS